MREELGQGWPKTETIGNCLWQYCNHLHDIHNEIFEPEIKQWLIEILISEARLMAAGLVTYMMGTSPIEASFASSVFRVVWNPATASNYSQFFFN